MKEMEEILKDVPKLDWFERYKRMLDIAYTSLMTAESQIRMGVEPERAIEAVKELHKSFGSACAEKLVKKFDLKPTVEDALKLFLLYSCEVWGYGETKYVSAKLESPKRGVYDNLVCRGWELAKKMGMEEMMKEVNCAEGCIAEYSSILGALSPDLKAKMIKALPWGDDVCEWVVEEK